MNITTVIVEDNVEYCKEIKEQLNKIENIDVAGCFQSLEDTLNFLSLDQNNSIDFFYWILACREWTEYQVSAKSLTSILGQKL